ncbi:MAG: hypothetical protein ACSHW0_01295 [Thalassotalea sp.]
MKQQWLQMSNKFSLLSRREMGLIILSGVVVFFMLPFNLLIEKNLSEIKKQNAKVTKLSRANIDADFTINELKQALKSDPNKALEIKISQLENRLASVDQQLLTLTQDLVDPIQMRQALIQLLKVQKGVSLTAFNVLPAQPLLFSGANTDEVSDVDTLTVPTAKAKTPEKISLGLYRHSIQITLTGKYFQLRDYLQQLEDLPWQFFWHDFHYQLIEYPKSELKIEIYSLSTNQEFIGV